MTLRKRERAGEETATLWGLIQMMGRIRLDKTYKFQEPRCAAREHFLLEYGGIR